MITKYRSLGTRKHGNILYIYKANSVAGNLNKNMKLTNDDISRALKISRAIQDYFDNDPFQKVLRSTDAYDLLVKKNLVEVDRHSGYKLRAFLHKLKDNDALRRLIPQCRAEDTRGNFTNWYFESAKNKTVAHGNLIPMSQIDRPQTLNIDDIKLEIQKLPKRDPIGLTLIELETRKKYPRAYEFWSVKEEGLLRVCLKTPC